MKNTPIRNGNKLRFKNFICAKNGNRSQCNNFKRDKFVGTLVGTLKIEKCRTACGIGCSLQFDSRFHLDKDGRLLCAKSGRLRFYNISNKADVKVLGSITVSSTKLAGKSRIGCSGGSTSNFFSS
jgi:hypothetical protein